MSKRRTDDERAQEFEEKAARLRAQSARRTASEKDKLVKSMLATSRALKRFAKVVDARYVAGILTAASDLEREADRRSGQARVDDTPL